MTLRTQTAILLSIGALLAGGLLWWAPRDTADDTTASATASANTPACTAFRDRTRAYEGVVEVTIASGSREAPPEIIDLSLSIRGDETDDVLLMLVTDATSSEEDGELATTTRDLEGQTIALDLQDDCAIERAALPSSLDSRGHVLVRSLVAAMDMRVRVGPRWNAHQVDNVGEYAASYQRRGDGRISRQKLRYTRIFGPTSIFKLRVRSRTHFKLGEFGWFERLEHFEANSLGGGPSGGLTVSMRFELAMTSATPSPVERPDQLAWSDLREPLTLESEDRHADAAAGPPGPETIEEILSLLEGLEGLELTRSAPTIARGLIANPALIEEVARRLAQPDGVADPHRPTLFLALEIAGTPEAQTALQGLMTDERVAVADRLRAVVALKDVDQPTSESVESLVEVARRSREDGAEGTVGRSALLSLASLSGRDLEGPLDEQAKRESAALIQDALQNNDRTLALEAMGNHGGAEYSETIDAHLGHDDLETRRAAIAAVRSRPPDAQDRVLAPRLAEEEDPRVIRSIAGRITAAGQGSESIPSPDMIASARAAFDRGLEQNDTRIALIRMVGGAAERSEAARQLLREFYAAEEDPRVRQVIGEYMSSEALTGLGSR